ncbi:MAG: hypothetical protein H7101_08955 [Deinococcales bacterium]|nr:hypothetical protein [Chitinophagaceae bacterium]
MTITFSMNCSENDQRGSLSLLRNLLDRLEKSVGCNRFNLVELKLYEKFDDEAKNGKIAYVKISSDNDTFIGMSVSKTWFDAMLNAFDFVQQKIETAMLKPEVAFA